MPPQQQIEKEISFTLRPSYHQSHSLGKETRKTPIRSGCGVKNDSRDACGNVPEFGHSRTWRLSHRRPHS
jgi:hypothetical protein